jgi:hypothetical protein
MMIATAVPNLLPKRKRIKRFFGLFSILALVILTTVVTPLSYGATSLTQFGITWTFDGDYSTGTFANGDYWVIGPVKIVSIIPSSSPNNFGPSTRTMHGSMVNPSPRNETTQGYDSAMYGRYGPHYDSRLNFALNVLVNDPLPSGSSLVSSISLAKPGFRPQLKTVAILTVLSEEPPAGSFRPPYTGSDKTIYHNKSELDYSKLTSLSRVEDSPSLSDVEEHFEKPWIDHIPSWTGRYSHPKDNMPDYGRQIANTISEAALSLMLDYTNAEKETLLIRFVQLGIDLYGIAKDGGSWPDFGCHMHGRKLPILMAGLILNDAEMLDIVDASKHFIFQEDRQTWFVEQRDVGRKVRQEPPKYPRKTYLPKDIGMPEWGIHHIRQEQQDDQCWTALYRNIVGTSILGHVLVARLLGAESLWNWPPLFAYIDRFWEMDKDRTSGANKIPSFVKNMWFAYGDQ